MLWLENGISSFPIAFYSISTIKIICIKFSFCPGNAPNSLLMEYDIWKDFVFVHLILQLP